MAEREQVPSAVQKGFISVPERLKEFNRTESFAVLATVDTDNGRPYTSLVAYAITDDLRRVLFTTPKGTRKYKNILNSEHVALLIDNRQKSNKNIMVTEAVTITGIARPVRRGKVREEYVQIFLKKHPDFEDFTRSATTAIIVLDIVQCIHVGKFQTVTVWDCC
jgi:heme iron utilization protein